jgi:peroxiredoxin
MKKFAFLLILFSVICSFKVTSQKIKVNCTVDLNGTYQPDSVFIGLYPTQENYYEQGANAPNPVIFSRVLKNKLSFEADPGIYMIGCCAWKYTHTYRLIYLDPKEKTVELKFKMQPLAIGYGHKMDKIEKVEITGDFNGFSTNGRLQLVGNNNVWKLEKIPPELKPGQKYNFLINGEVTEDLSNDKIVTDKLWLMYYNIYSDNEIVFNPALYGKPENPSQVEIKNPSVLNEQFMLLVTEVTQFKKHLNEKAPALFKQDPEIMRKTIDSLYLNLSNIEKKYDSGFRQFFIETYLEQFQIKLISIYPDEFFRGRPTPEKEKEFYEGEAFSDFFDTHLKLIQELDSNSFLLEGDFTNFCNRMNYIIKDHPEILTKYNLPVNYFNEFPENFIKNSPNERMCCKVLLSLAVMQMRDNEAKAKEMLDMLSKYQYEKYIPKDRINSMYAQLNVKIGKQAPDFSITTLEGNNIKLSDFKGRFVFIDFWGSWCSPCLKEIPHIKTFYSKVSRNKLEIIGLAGNDKEESLKQCISKNEIKYPNALASSSLLSEYGIRKFPTSFLVNPDGKIIRIDMRGEDELNLVAEEIERYFK